MHQLDQLVGTDASLGWAQECARVALIFAHGLVVVRLVVVRLVVVRLLGGGSSASGLRQAGLLDAKPVRLITLEPSGKITVVKAEPASAASASED